MSQRSNKSDGYLVDQEEERQPLNQDNQKEPEKPLSEEFLTVYGEAQRLARLDVYYGSIFTIVYLVSVISKNLYFSCMIGMIISAVVNIIYSSQSALIQKYLKIKPLKDDYRNLAMVVYVYLLYYTGDAWYRIPLFILVLVYFYGSAVSNHPFPFQSTNIRFSYCTIVVSVFMWFYLYEFKQVPVWIILATFEGLALFSRFVEANTDRKVLTAFELFYCQVEYSQLLIYIFLPLLRGIPPEYIAFKLFQTGIYLYIKWELFGSYVVIHFQQLRRKILSQTSQNSYMMRLPNEPEQILRGNMVGREQLEFTEEVCVFCHKKNPSFVSLVCMHACMCLSCAKKQMKKYSNLQTIPYLMCPICNAFVVGYNKKEPYEGYRMFWRRKGVDTKKSFLGKESYYTFNQTLTPLNLDRE